MGSIWFPADYTVNCTTKMIQLLAFGPDFLIKWLKPQSEGLMQLCKGEGRNGMKRNDENFKLNHLLPPSGYHWPGVPVQTLFRKCPDNVHHGRGFQAWLITCRFKDQNSCQSSAQGRKSVSHVIVRTSPQAITFLHGSVWFIPFLTKKNAIYSFWTQLSLTLNQLW